MTTTTAPTTLPSKPENPTKGTLFKRTKAKLNRFFSSSKFATFYKWWEPIFLIYYTWWVTYDYGTLWPESGKAHRVWVFFEICLWAINLFLFVSHTAMKLCDKRRERIEAQRNTLPRYTPQAGSTQPQGTGTDREIELAPLQRQSVPSSMWSRFPGFGIRLGDGARTPNMQPMPPMPRDVNPEPHVADYGSRQPQDQRPDADDEQPPAYNVASAYDVASEYDTASENEAQEPSQAGNTVV